MASNSQATNIKPASRSYIMAGLMLTMGLAAMDGTIVATAIQSIVHELGGFSLFPWVFSVYLLVQAAMVPIYGKLADIYGRKPMLLIGSAIFLLGSMLSGLSWNMVALIAFRGVQGVGAAA
ncbi:MAG: MFS transporter, partial [Sulfobacillus sp.]